MKVVFAEKPDVGRKIAAVLGAGKKVENGLEGGGYLVVWASGHLVEQKEPGAMNPAWEKWDMSALPMIPEDDAWGCTPIAKKRDLWRTVKAAFTDKGVECIIVATDAGREGELIFRRCYEQSRSKKPFKRLWLQSLTPEAIREAIAKMKDGHAYDNLADAAECRSRADWLIGMNGSRAYTLINRTGGQRGNVLRIGRVQTPTLALLCARADEIENFKPEKYFELDAQIRADKGPLYKGIWFDPKASEADRKTWIKDRAVVDALAAACKGRPSRVVECKTTPKREAPPKLPDLGELQRSCNRRFGFTAKHTLDVAQALYEKHQAISYPRTDSRYLPSDVVPKIGGILKGIERIFSPESTEAQRRFVAAGRKLSKAYCDDSKVTDHHAIIPTGEMPSGLSPDEEKVFDFVCRRFMSIFFPDYEYDAQMAVTAVDASTGAQELFRSTGKAVRIIGWKGLFGETKRDAEGDDDDDDAFSGILPPLEVGDKGKAESLDVRERQTQPPRMYNDATLIKAMETAGKLVDDDELAEAMKARGLGTPATRAAIIEQLVDHSYVTRRKKELVPSPLGRALIKGVMPELKTASMTGEWELRLGRIEQGKEDWHAYMADMEKFTRDAVSRVMSAGATVSVARADLTVGDAGDHEGGCNGDNGHIGRCPACREGEIQERDKFFGCSKWSREGGCDFKLWKDSICHAKISASTAKALVEGQLTRPLKMRSKAGKEFSAQLRLNADHKLEIVFGNNGNSKVSTSEAVHTSVGATTPEPSHSLNVKCPMCKKGAVVGFSRGWKCDACDWKLWDTICEAKLSEDMVLQLIDGGMTHLLWMKSKAGKDFKASVRLKPDGKAELVFALRRAI